MSINDWKNDKCVKNWFELLGNPRTMENYNHDFPNFLDTLMLTHHTKAQLK
jgi:hypothetical protein